MQLFQPINGALIIVAFAVTLYGVTSFFLRRKRMTKTEFLVAGRTVSWKRNSFSIAAAWIWAPALFVAAEQGYKNGWVGVFWFTVPNVLCLILFAFFATRMRKVLPEGFTLSGFMRNNYSTRVQRVYLVCLGGLAIASFAVQLLAGGLVVSTLTGLSFPLVTVMLAALALAYSLRGGLGASIITDFVMMSLMAIVGLVLAPWAVANAGLDTLFAGMNGFDGLKTSLVSGPGAGVFWAFGLSTSIGLMSGPFGDQSFWSRTFASRPRDVKKAFIVGAGIFAVVPLTMSLLGFLAAGAQLQIGNTQLTNLAAIIQFLPAWTVLPFMLFVLAGLSSTLDSNLSSISALVGHDLIKTPGRVVHFSRVAMVCLALAGIALANMPGLTITALFIFYGTLRASTLLPTVLSLWQRRPQSERGMFWGIVAALVIGIPMSAYGNLNNLTEWKVAGSLAVIVLSGGICAAWTGIERYKERGGSLEHTLEPLVDSWIPAERTDKELSND